MENKDSELIKRLMEKVREVSSKPNERNIEIKVADETEKLCSCPNDEPYCDGTVEDCKCECECHGLYSDETPKYDFDLDTEECRKVQDEARFERKFKRVRHSDMFTNKMSIDFERVDLPAPDEITDAQIYYDSTEGKQVLCLTIKPLGHDTYLEQFLNNAYLGKVYMLNKNDDVKKTYESIVLSENCLCRRLDCNRLIGGLYNDRLEYMVEVEL